MDRHMRKNLNTNVHLDFEVFLFFFKWTETDVQLHTFNSKEIIT